MSGGAAADQPEVAQHLVFDPGENEARIRVRAVRHPAEERRVIETLRRETDADQLLWRASAAAPYAAALAGGAVEVFAGLRLPRARSALGLAHLDQVRFVGMIRRDPIETVAAEIH